MSNEERKNHNIVAMVLIETFKKYGFAKADCGHYIFPEEFGMVETQEGKFLVLCKECMNNHT